MAELYAKPYEVIDTGYNPQQTQQGGQDAEMQSYLESLPPEERQKAIERINAPLTGEELALMAQSGQRMPTLEDFAEIEKYHKNHEISFIDGLGKIAEGGEQVMTDLTNAMGSFFKDPADATSKMPATAVEAFAQGTRNFYGMLAQSGNPDSTLFRVKDFLNGTGTIEDRYNQYMEALKFNRESADLAEGKMTMVMDKDMINHEVTQAMAYIADPTLFIPFGKVASTGLRAVGLGEKLAMAGARSAAIKNGIIGNTLKWGAGQPLEFMGGAVRNTIDFGLEKAGAAFEATTGIGAKEFAQTARMSGIGFSASAVAGHAVPYASTISDAYIVGSSAKGFGEALTLLGDTMKKNPFGRGVRSWAAESLKQAEKNGVALSPHAKGLLKTLDAVDPLFAYGWNGLETAAEGALIGGGLGYLSGGEEGMYSGIGAGIALGAVGGTAGKVVADVTGGTNIARRAVQAKMTIEGHKVINPEKAMFFQGMQKAAEVRGKDVDLVNSIIIGIDEVAPNFEFHALTPEQFVIEAAKKGYNPETGKFMEMSAIDSEFGGDRASKSKAMYVLRSIGGDFVGNRQGFLDALKKASAKDTANPKKPASNIPLALRKYTDVAKTFEKLSKTQQEAILKEIDGQTNIAKELGGTTKLREYYDSLSWSEAWTDSLVKKFESDREGARKDITDMLAQETNKKGELTSKGRALTDKLRAEGFLDKEGKLLRERNLLQADLTFSQFEQNKGAVVSREADGKTHMYINLKSMGDETFPHELFHTIMRESPMKKHFTDSLVTKLLGTVDKDGNLVRPAEVNIGQVTKFFKKYIDLTQRNPDGTLDAQASDAMFRQVQDALTEYQNAGGNKKISDKARGLLENYSEEFGAYYFSHWLMGRNRNTLFFGGELKGIEGLVERTKDSFMDFWQSKISKSNPEFDFTQGLNASFDRSKGLGRIGAIDYYMRDMVRAASNANREAFRPDAMTLDNLKDFERSNGIRNLTSVDSNRRLNPREQVTQNIRLGKEAYKILSGLDKNLRTSKDVLDENGKQVITGRLSENELDALVKGGIVPRAWADKVNQGYAMLDGTISNIFSAGYLGKTEQTTDASYPRLTGRDVAFKNRKAVLFDVETKVKADGTFYTLFHTLDLAVIEQEANRLWQNTDYRNLWNGDRASMEADFFRYLSNASRASTDPKKLDSAALLEKGDGLGAQRRDVLHQMGRMALQTGDAYKHQPIAVIPEGFRHSVTTFNIDGMTMPRVDTGTRVDIDMKNAHKFIRENWQPDDMKQEKTPAGTLMTHESGFKFSNLNGKTTAYTSVGAKIGIFNSIKEATIAGKNKFNEVYKNHDAEVKKVFEKKNEEAKRFQALDENERQEAIRNGDLFSLERVREFIKNRKVLRQTREEFIISKVIEAVENPEILKNAVLKALFLNNKTALEYRTLLQEFVKVGEAEKKLADEHGVLYEQWLRTTDANERSMLTQKMTENSEAAQVLQVQRPKVKLNLERFELEMQKERVLAFVELQNSMSHATPEQFIEIVKNELMLTYNPVLGGKYKAIKKAHSGIAETLFAKEFDDQTQTGVPIVVIGTHGTKNVELMISRILLDEKLGSRYGKASGGSAYSSDLGHFMGGSTDTSYAYAGLPPSAFTLYAKNGIPINRLAEFLGDGAFLNPYSFPESHPVYRLNKAIFELKKNSQKVNSDLLFKATDAYLELFDKGDKLSYDDLLAKAREVQGILAHLKEIGFINPKAHKLLIDFTVEAFDKSVRKERPNPISRDEFNYHINNAEDLVIDSAFSPLDEVRVSVDELLGGGLKSQDKEIKIPEGKPIKVKYDNELYKEVVKLSQETINTLTDTNNGWMGKTNFENKVKIVIGGKKFYEGSSTVDPARTWMQTRMLMAFDNPKVIIDPRGYDESKLAPQMLQAINEGHDGIIFKRLRDGGSEDDIYIQLKGNQNKILTIDTSFDSQHIPRKDENGNVLKTGRDIGLALQPTDEGEAPKKIQGIKLDMTKAYDVFRKEYEESTGQSWTQDKFMQRASNWQFFGDENGFVAVRPQRSGFVKLVGMAGDNKSKLRGIQQIQQMGLPVWGMVSKDIKDIAVKRGMREPNMIERTLLKQALNSAALGDAEILGYTPDNGVRLRYPDIGEVTKYMIGSPEYYQKLRSAFGEQVKSKIGFQPTDEAEGGRVYDQNSREFKYSFIGKWAEENPDKLKGYDLEFIDRGTKYGTHNVRIRLQDNSTVGMTQDVGHITADIDPKTKVASLSSNIGVKYRGNKLSYALYSEMAERLRSMGVQKVDGTIVNPDGIPIKVRERIIGNTRVLRSDGSSGVPIDYKQGARIIQKRQAESGNTWGGLDVVNELDFNARYQPAEGEQGGRVYTEKQMSSEFIGRYAAENAKVTKGLKPKFSIFGSGDQGNIELMKGQDSLGYINFSFSKATGDALIEYTTVAGKQQGKGYGNLLYSELVERLRSMGMKEVQGMIIDEQGRPQKIRERIIDRENARIGGDRTQIDYVEKDPDSDATHTGVTSYLKQKAWYQPAEDWSTQRAIKARENQPRELWTYPNTENFKKWAGKLKFIDNEESANKGGNYDKGFVTTVFKGVSVRSFDKFSERAKVELGERPVNTDPNFFIADETAAERYAGGGYFDVNSLNKDAQKAASRGKADMYYIKSNKPANLLNAHKLEANNPRLYQVINRFWENNIKEDGHSVLDPRTKVDRFLLEIAMGDWLSPRDEMTTISPFGQPWRMDNWVKFHEHLLKNGYDSVVIFDNSVSKKAPTIVVPQETAKVKGSSNYGEFSRTDTRYNFQPAEYSEFKSEQSPTGRILRNAKGYVIMLANNKFRVYNPAKAIIGVYGSEEEAKKRIYREIPKR